MQKGTLIYLEGRIHTRQWETKEGEKKTSTEIIAINLKILKDFRPRDGNSDATAPDEDVPF